MRGKKNNAVRFQSEAEMTVKLELMGFLETEAGWTGDRHEHAFWELVFMETGRGVLYHGGRQYTIHGGDLFLFEPHVEHRFVPDKRLGSRHLYIGFSVDGGAWPWPPHLAMPVLDKAVAFSVTEPLTEIVARITARKERAQFDRCSGDVLSVLLKLLSEWVAGSEASEASDRRGSVLAKKVKEYLAAHLAQNVSVQELARSFYLSPHYFGDLFKRHTGMTIKEYHTLLRLQEAENMLSDADVTVSEVADALGFNSIHYFSRKFKQVHGVSPTEFRERMHG